MSTTTQATIKWSQAYATSTYPIISYELQQNSCDYEMCSTTWVPCINPTLPYTSANIPFNVTSYTAYGLAPITQYFFRIRAKTSAGDGPWSAIKSSTIWGQTGPTGPHGGPVGPIGPTGRTGPTGRIGLTGPTGAVSTAPSTVPGPTGPTGAASTAPSTVSGPTGPTGRIGPTGLGGQAGQPGPTGQPGQPGQPGQSGQSGSTGSTGPTGRTGPTGLAGVNGVTGPTGSIYKAGLYISTGYDVTNVNACCLIFDVVSEINPSAPPPYLLSNTCYSFSQGDTVTVSQATSTAFPVDLTGSSTNYFVATVSSYTCCTSSSPSCVVNQIILNPTGIFSGTTNLPLPTNFVINLAGSIGPTGVTGSTGSTGHTGHTGHTGLAGVNGVTGTTGTTGTTGPTGGPGPTGSTGQGGAASTVTGPTGPTGSAYESVAQYSTGWDITNITPASFTLTTPNLSYKGGEYVTLVRQIIPPPGGLIVGDYNNYFVAQVIGYFINVNTISLQPVSYKGTGSYVNFILNLSGAVGPTGANGAASTVTGPTGITGPTGATGPTGNTGPTGQSAIYVPYTPTTNITLGTGGTIVGMYAQQGELTNVYVHITLGSSAFTVVTGPTVSLPVTANNMTINSNTGIALNGIATFVDTSVPQSVYGIITYNTTLDVEIRPYLSSGNYQVLGQLTQFVPFTWGSGDEFFIIFSYHSVPPP